MTLLVLIQVVFYWIQASNSNCFGGECFRYHVQDEDAISDHVLIGHVITNVTLGAGQTCEMMCSMECACVSFNEKEAERKCTLNYESNRTMPQDIRPMIGYTYTNFRIYSNCQDNVDQQYQSASVCENFCCTPSPCHHGAQCTEICNESWARFNCTCPEGLYGSLCQLQDFCAENPCLNNGKCTSGKNGYTCTCSPDYDGERCQHLVKKSPIKATYGGLCVSPVSEDCNPAENSLLTYRNGPTNCDLPHMYFQFKPDHSLVHSCSGKYVCSEDDAAITYQVKLVLREDCQVSHRTFLRKSNKLIQVMSNTMFCVHGYNGHPSVGNHLVFYAQCTSEKRLEHDFILLPSP